MRSRYALLPFLVGTLLLQACSKDQDLDDYKKTRLDKNLAQLQAVGGTYSGYVKSKKDGLNLGALQMSLKATTQVENSNDESKASAQPILIVNVEFQGATHMAIVAQNSYYDPDSGKFQASIPVQQQNAQGQTQNVTVSFTGVISGGTITGTLEALGYSDFGGSFVLNNHGASLDSLAHQASFASDIIFSQKDFTGKTSFTNGVSKSVKMILLKPQTTSENDFLTLLVPVKPVQVTLNYGDGAHLLFANGNLDQRTGTLTGQSSVTVTSPSAGSTNTQSVNLSLSCNIAQDSRSLNCAISTNSSSGNVANLALVASTANDKDPDDSSTTRDPVIRSYQGQAQMSPGADWIPVVLNAVYPARTRMDEIMDLYFPQTEKNLQVSFTLSGSPVGVSFPTVKWDSSKGTLDASQILSVDNQSANLSLSCQHFFFDTTNNPFTCTYSSSLTNNYVQLKFNSKN